ncbi:MAG: ECF-type sigma factor [Planctomycetota bacterium]
MSDADSARDVTLALRAAADGDADGRTRLFEAVYEALRNLASKHLARERADHTLQATALVHEAWIKLVDQAELPAGGREHFLAVASHAMRRILVDHARGRNRAKRGGGAERVGLDALELDASLDGAPSDDALDVLALDTALLELAERSERQVKVVELRFFGGLPVAEVATALDVSESTVEREWRIARAWLLARLAD